MGSLDYCISHRAAGHTEKTEGRRRDEVKRAKNKQRSKVRNQRTRSLGERTRAKRQ